MKTPPTDPTVTPAKPLNAAQRAEIVEGTHTRECVLARDVKPAEDGMIPVAFSTESEVDRGWYTEVLDHGPGAVQLDQARSGMAFLDGHDRDKLLGRALNVRVEKDRVGRADIRFSSAEEVQRVRQDMLDGIRPDISVGYTIQDYIEEVREGQLYIRATKWTPKEISTVSVPADYMAGVGRGDTTPAPALPAKPSTTAERKQTSAGAANTKEGAMTPEEILAAEKAASEKARGYTARILEIADANKIPTADTTRALKEEWAVEKFLDHALELARKAAPGALPGPTPVESAEQLIGSRSDAREYSYARAINAALDMREGRTPENCLELELSREMEKSLPRGYKRQGGGLLVPMQILKKRDGLDSMTATKGTELKANMQPGELIELLRNASVLLKMGMQTLTGLTGPLPFPKQTGAASFYWVAENPGVAVTKSAPTFGSVTLSPKTLMATIPYSRQLVALGNPSVEAIVRNEMAIGAALAIDKAGIYGIAGSAQPRGLYIIPDVNVVAMGGNVSFGELVDMATEMAKDNALLGNLGYITTPGMAGKLMQSLVASAAGSAMIWTGRHDEGIVAGYRAISSNQISSAMSGSAETGGSEHGIIFGNYNDMIYGTWGIQEIIVDPLTRKGEAMIEVTSYQLADVMARHGESFCKSTGATLA